MFPAYPTEIVNAPTDARCGSWNDGIPSFALIGESGDKCVYVPGCCKEYILDYTYNKFVNKKVVYTTVQQVPATINEVRLFVGNWKKYIPAAVDLLNQIESVLDIPHSIPFEIPNNKEAYVFRGSPRWLIAPPMFSFYGLIIRAANKHIIGTSYKDTFQKLSDTAFGDGTLWRGAMPAIQILLKYGDRAIFGQDPKRNWVRDNGHDIHSWGVYNWGTNYLKQRFPDFYYFYERE